MCGKVEGKRMCEYRRGRGDKQCMSKGRVVSEGRI